MTVGPYAIEWSWNGFSAVISTLALIVAIFGETLREYLFRPKIKIQEFTSIVPKSRNFLSDPAIYEHHLEIIHSGRPIENVKFEVLKMVSNPTNDKQGRPFYPAALTFPLSYGETLTTRDTVKVAEANHHSENPKLSVEISEHPWLNRENDPHYRGRLYVRIIGKNYRSDIWPVDLVKDSNIVSGWRLEVHHPESETKFFKKYKNYIREYNTERRREDLP